MFDRIIRFSISNRWFVLLITLVIGLVGVFNYKSLTIDAVPDITNVQVQINTAAPGYTPLEVEQRVTFPLELSLSGLPRLDYTRSISRYGLSQVTVVFKDGTDIYFARQVISQRVQEAREKLPAGIAPTLGPVSTGLGEIFMYTVENIPGSSTEKLSPTELRSAQDWIVKPQLRTVEGVVDVNSIGGYEKQFHVTPKIDRLLGLGLTLNDLVAALASNNSSVGAGYIERNGQQYLVRVPGQVQTIEEIKQIVVTTRERKPIFIQDVADVSLGQELRTGAATENGEEVVLGTVFMLVGENSRAVSQRVGKKIEEINSSLPKGLIAKPVYDRTVLVDKTIHTVKKNLFEGALLVIAVLFFFLGNFKAALITALVIPLSMLFTITGMVKGGISANLMSLGALDFGIIVDGSVVIVENCLRRLAEEQHRLGRKLNLSERFAVVLEASKEVRQATMFGELIIMIVYLPILSLTGVEGKMFHPMAITVVLALLGAMFFSVTFIPAAIALFITGKVSETEGNIFSVVKRAYSSLLSVILARPRTIVSAGALIFVLSLGLGVRLGTEFIPSLDEGDIALHALRIPGTSLTQAIEMQKSLENKLHSLPEVSHTFTKIGTAEIANDPMPPNVADGFVILRPRSEWPDASKSKSEIVREVEELLKTIPGNNYEFTQPIQMRFNELLAGVRSDVAVKLFGDDMALMFKTAQEISEVLEKVPGASDVKVEQITGLPILSIEVDRAKVSRMGINIAEVQSTVQSAIGGATAGQLFEGDRRFEIVVRFPEEVRSNIDLLGSLPIALPEAAKPLQAAGGHVDSPPRSFVPLSSIAEIIIAEGPNQISRENGKRVVIVTANVRGRDLGGFVEEASRLLKSSVKIPVGYWTTWGGQFEQLISAKARLAIVVPAALIIILGLLYYSFGSLRSGLIVFSGIPFALSGGILFLWLRGIPLSVSAGVGFIALSGVAVLNGLVMLSFIQSLFEKGTGLLESIIEGAITRLRPVLMTALVAALGFVPMALSTGAGAEVQRPLATVVIGGIFSSTALTLVILPAIILLFFRKLAPASD